jgi:hypothetical protein
VYEMKVKLLRYLLIFSGVYEIAFGAILMFLVEPLFSLLGILNLPINYPVFSQVAGLLAICFGLILYYSARDPERFVFVAIVSVALRITLQAIIVYNSIILPFMATALLSFGSIDLVLAILTLAAIKLE